MRFLRTAILAIGLAALAAGCGGKDKGPEAPADPAGDPATEEPVGEEPVGEEPGGEEMGGDEGGDPCGAAEGDPCGGEPE